MANAIDTELSRKLAEIDAPRVYHRVSAEASARHYLHLAKRTLAALRDERSFRLRCWGQTAFVGTVKRHEMSALTLARSYRVAAARALKRCAPTYQMAAE